MTQRLMPTTGIAYAAASRALAVLCLETAAGDSEIGPGRIPAGRTWRDYLHPGVTQEQRQALEELFDGPADADPDGEDEE